MDRTSSLNQLADLLDRVRSANEHDARTLMLAASTDLHEDARDVWTNVWHYVSDGDIRRGDPSYHQMQERQIDGLITALREAAPRGTLLAYTLLA